VQGPGLPEHFSGELLWHRSSIAGGLAGDVRMIAIHSTCKRVRRNFNVWKFLAAE
jgi:hypothetical protein